MAGLLSTTEEGHNLILRSLVAAARELPLPTCRELARRINEFVLLEAQADEHDFGPHANDSKQRYLAAIRAFAEVIGRVPSSTDYLAEYERRRDLDDTRLPSLSAIVKFFGGWSAAVAAASLAPEPPATKVERIRGHKGSKVHTYPEQRLIEALHACARDLGKPPTVREYTAWREEKLAGSPGKRPPGADIPHYRTLQDQLGSWLNALEAAGFGDHHDLRAKARDYAPL